MLKKIISTALVLISITASALSYSGVFALSQNSDIRLVGKYTLSGSQNIGLATYNAKDEGKCAELVGNDTGRKYRLSFSDAIGKVSKLVVPKSEAYSRRVGTATMTAGDKRCSYSYSDTNTTYYRIRIKLCDLFPYYYRFFNADGTMTQSNHDFKFKREQTSEGTYDSVLVIASGGMFTQCVPDENGEVEFYISSDINHEPKIYTAYEWKTADSSGMDSFNLDLTLSKVSMGNVNNDYSVDINDVTSMQYRLAELTAEFGEVSALLADVDGNGTLTINDVTALQNYLIQ